jgi:hypothetical protein
MAAATLPLLLLILMLVGIGLTLGEPLAAGPNPGKATEFLHTAVGWCLVGAAGLAVYGVYRAYRSKQ